MRLTVLFGTILALTLTVAAGSTSADDAEAQKVLARAQRMIRQAMLERDAVQAENAKLKIQIEELNRKLAGVKKSSEAALAKSHESNTALNGNLQETVQKLRQTESDKNQLQDTVNGQAELIQSCESKNAELVEYDRELLGRYRKKGVFDALLQREPFTQLKRVEIENIEEEYRDRIDRMQIKRREQSVAR
ncbi:MAG: hypothetical protein ACYDBW_11585 [Sulfuricaulis sp.]